MYKNITIQVRACRILILLGKYGAFIYVRMAERI